MAVDYFLELKDIPGEATAEYAKNQIAVLSWSWGGSQSSSISGTGGSGAGKVSMSDFSITKEFDKASPQLLKALTLGTHIATGKLTAYKAGGKNKAYLMVEFEELYVTSLQQSASGENPMESVSFTFGKFSVTYGIQGKDGTIATQTPVTYNVTTNVSS